MGDALAPVVNQSIVISGALTMKKVSVSLVCGLLLIVAAGRMSLAIDVLFGRNWLDVGISGPGGSR